MRERTEKLAKLNLETEGLLALALKRGEETPEQVWRMIKEKTEESLEIIKTLLDETAAAEPEEEKGNADQPSAEATSKEEPFQEAAAETARIEAAPEAKTAEPSYEEIPHTEPPAEVPEEAAGETSSEDEAGVIATDEEPAGTGESETETVNEIEIETEAAAEAETESTTVKAEANSDIEAESEKTAKDLRKFFTINDLFRFKRELFGNDTQEFDESLEALSNMNAVPEAREYLRDKAGTEMGKDEMKEFIAILRNYFKSKKGD